MTSRASQDSDVSCRQAIDLDESTGDQTPRLRARAKSRPQPSRILNSFDSYDDSLAPTSTSSSIHPSQTDAEDVCGDVVEEAVKDVFTSQRPEADAFTCKPFFAAPHTLRSFALDALLFAWASFCHLLLTAWPYTSLFFIAVSVLFRWTASIYIILFIISTLLLPKCPHSRGTIAVCDALFFRHWRRYVSYRVTYDPAIQRDQQYVVAEFPHGVFPVGGQLHASVWSSMHSTSISLLAANVLLLVPLWRHYMSACGVKPATACNIRHVLQEGNSIAVHVGGIAEMFETHADKETIFLQKRRGFIKMAIEHGVPVIPMYHFGNSRLLKFLPRFMQGISRKLRVSLGVFVGQFMLPIPRSIPVWTVAGAPIDMGPGMPRDDAQFNGLVELKHAEFTAALTALYEGHRGEYFDGRQSWMDRPLHIL